MSTMAVMLVLALILLGLLQDWRGGCHDGRPGAFG
jgi:hypothetical protein